MNDKTELKPCPFCGGEADVFSRYGGRKWGWFVFVKCEICDAQSKTRTAFGSPENDDFFEQNAVISVIDSWNRREEE